MKVKDKCDSSIQFLVHLFSVQLIRFPKTLNDFRPIALTSIVMKCFVKIVKKEILKNTDHDLEFAYRPNRRVEDATGTLLNLLFKHLEGKGAHARLLFIDNNKLVQWIF